MINQNHDQDALIVYFLAVKNNETIEDAKLKAGQLTKQQRDILIAEAKARLTD